MTTSFDLIVIGGGPGGYVAAVRGAQCGLTVAIIEKDSTLGGTCLNRGCIPSKALLDSSELFHQASHKFEVHGIKVSTPKIDIKQMMKRKADVIEATTKGIDYLMSKNKITRLVGTASFIDKKTLMVTNGKKKEEITGSNIIIATGSEVTPLPPVPTDGKRIITSTEALELTEVPKHLVVVGGGVIGVEIGSVYARLGAKVTVVEFMDALLPTMDRELGKHLQRSLKKIGFTFNYNTKVTGAKASKTGVKVTAEDKKGKALSIDCDYVLVSIGRRPYTEGLGLDKIGLTTNERGQIDIDDHFKTAVDGVYAIGDVVRGPMLAHKASEEGVACVEMIVGQKPHLNYMTIPGVVYTWPEVASVGKTEEELKAAGVDYKKGSFPFKASGRARASEETEGFIKVLADKTTDEVLGVHMIGPRCADLISEALVAMEYRASAEDIGIMMHPHPTFSEALKEAALAATGDRAIHF
jgi:dihydrolipoamide dehydrogenase